LAGPAFFAGLAFFAGVRFVFGCRTSGADVFFSVQLQCSLVSPDRAAVDHSSLRSGETASQLFNDEPEVT
jgi:hypothetical protein